MITNRDDAIEIACALQALVYHSIGDYSEPNDGFCNKCPSAKKPEWQFRHTITVALFERDAILAKLKADGYRVNEEALTELNSLLGEKA